MECEYVEEIRSTTSNTNKPFPAGLRVLLVDDDPICLKIVGTMLRLSLYEVVSVDEGSNALKMLRERQGGFDLVITDVHMPVMDGFALLEHVVREFRIPVIMMSADDKLKVVTRGLESGACFYFLKPLTLNDVQNLWQHVVRQRKEHYIFDRPSPNLSLHHEQIAILKEGCASSFDVGESSRGREQDSNKRKAKEIARSDSSQEQDNEDDDRRDRPGSHKKARVVWTPTLHDSFLEAIDRLGIDKAVPKKILELMNVPGLTRENVASHLQKYRIFIKRLKEASRTMDPRNPRCLSNLLGPGFALARPTLLNLQQGFPHYYQEQQRQWLQLQQAASHSSTSRITTSTRPSLMPPPPSSSSSSSFLLDHTGGASSSGSALLTRARTNSNSLVLSAHHHHQQWPGTSSMNISSTNINAPTQAITIPRPLYNTATNATVAGAGGSISNLSIFQAPQLSSFSAGTGSAGNNMRRSSTSSSSFGRFNNNSSQAPDVTNHNNNSLFGGTQQMGTNMNGGGDGGVAYSYRRMEEALNRVNMLSFGGESTGTGNGITASNNNIGSGTSSSSGYANTGSMSTAPNNLNAGYGNSGILANSVNAGYGNNNGLMGIAANNDNEFTGAPPFPNSGAQQQERQAAEAQEKDADGVGGEIDSWLQLLGGTTTTGTEIDFDSLLYPNGNQIMDPDFNVNEYQMEGNDSGY